MGKTSFILQLLVLCFMALWQHSFILEIKKNCVQSAANIFGVRIACSEGCIFGFAFLFPHSFLNNNSDVSV